MTMQEFQPVMLQRVIAGYTVKIWLERRGPFATTYSIQKDNGAIITIDVTDDVRKNFLMLMVDSLAILETM